MPQARTKFPPKFEAALREYISYDPETGILRWIKPRSKIKVGSPVGSRHKDGHLEAEFEGQSLRVHRLAWFLYYGYWPIDIDHWDTDKSNNRIKNLREVSNKTNTENRRKAGKANKSTGILGVSTRHDYPKPFRAKIYIKGKHVVLGYFDTAEEAQTAYIEAKRKYHKGNTL